MKNLLINKKLCGGKSMINHKLSQRLLKIVLSVVMMLGLVLFTASAETLPVTKNVLITAIKNLGKETTNQRVFLGNSMSDLTSPDKIQAGVFMENTEQKLSIMEAANRFIEDYEDGEKNSNYIQDGIKNEETDVVTDTGNIYTVSTSSTTDTNINWDDLARKLEDGTIGNGDTLKILESSPQ
jgi:hypothetical protein